MARIDLDAARRARAEGQGEPLVVVFGGEEFTLPVEVPYEYVHFLASSKPREAANALFGADADRFWAHQPSIDDMKMLLSQMDEHIGGAEGEAPASGSSSNGTSRRSRPTSHASTA